MDLATRRLSSAAAECSYAPTRVAKTLSTRTFRLRRATCNQLRFRSRQLARQHCRRHCQRLHVCAASRSYYDVLGVPKDADARTIKKAYKKMALKYHPDVNKQDNAKEVFMECKSAYQVLVDEKQRRQYDQTLNGDSGFDWGGLGDAFRGTSSSGSRRTVKPKEEEPFYGFTELFKDLEQDYKKRQARHTGEPRTLWQEISELGEEFVEFLEQEIEGATRKGAKQQTDATRKAEDQRKAAAATAQTAEERARRAKEEAEEAKRKTEQEVEDMLAELKSKLK